MTDLALDWLIAELQKTNPADNSVLWVVDENINEEWRSLAPSQWQIHSNRFDAAIAIGAIHPQCLFTDFDFSNIESGSLNAIYYRISKEKPVVHHIINEAFRLLKIGGALHICGYKNEGIKTYINKAANCFGSEVSPKKRNEAYTASIQKVEHSYKKLDDSDYPSLRNIGTEDAPFFSKPGQFGWNKLDVGSQLLIDTLCEHNIPLGENILDLGCGYGFITLKTSKLSQVLPAARWTLTDNNAAAIHSAKQNVSCRKLNAKVIADDCASHIDEKFTTVLCNPPFHQGFDVEGSLTTHFLHNAAKRLVKNGQAIFVVNAFIPLEKKAQQFFGQIETLANSGKFKVLRLSQPRSA